MSVLGLGTPEVDRWISAGKTDAEDPKSRRREGKGKEKEKGKGERKGKRKREW